eukprot:2334530-Pleurochrysis_carterae.AAC.1
MAWRGELTLPKTTRLIYLLLSLLYTDSAKPPKDPSIFRTECELRQQGVRRRDRDLGVDCLKRRSCNQLRDGKRGDRKSGRA